jgi:hypothetical protein
MASHTNNAGYSNEVENEVATPFNRPRPLWEINKSASPDPTAALLAEGGSLAMNDRDRAGLNVWFQNSFKNIFAPVRDRINLNFDKAFLLLHAHEDEVVKLRDENTTLRSQNATLRSDMKAEMSQWIETKNKEFTEQIHKIRLEIIEGRNEIQKCCALQTETVVDLMADRIRRELASEIMKMQNEVTEVRRGVDMTKIIADAARATEEGFTRLKKELAVEIAKSREESRRDARKASAKPAPAAKAAKGKMP